MESAEGTDYLSCAYSQRKAAKGQKLVLLCLSVRPSFRSLHLDKSTLTEDLKIVRVFQLSLIYDRYNGAQYFTVGKVIERKGFLCGSYCVGGGTLN
jgi:hypothetical protein